MKKVMSRVLLENNNPISLPGIYLITEGKTARKITYVIGGTKKGISAIMNYNTPLHRRLFKSEKAKQKGERETGRRHPEKGVTDQTRHIGTPL